VGLNFLLALLQMGCPWAVERMVQHIFGLALVSLLVEGIVNSYDLL
jgi:peptide methionine sulfoxide reductase MsrA